MESDKRCIFTFGLALTSMMKKLEQLSPLSRFDLQEMIFVPGVLNENLGFAVVLLKPSLLKFHFHVVAPMVEDLNSMGFPTHRVPV